MKKVHCTVNRAHVRVPFLLKMVHINSLLYISRLFKFFFLGEQRCTWWSVVNHCPFLLFIRKVRKEREKQLFLLCVCFDVFLFCFEGNLLLRSVAGCCHSASLASVVIATLFIGQDSGGGNHPLFAEMSSEISCGWWPRLWGYWSEVHRAKGALQSQVTCLAVTDSVLEIPPGALCSVWVLFFRCQIEAFLALNWLHCVSFHASLSIESSVVYFVCLSGRNEYGELETG